MDWAELEAKAAVWGTRIGAFIVVVGLGYLLSIGFGKLGLIGKTLTVYAACVGMWVTGLFFERKEKYSTWGKIMIGGGWAGIYITTFLIHALPPEMRVIEDAALDMYLLSGIAAGMIVHSLRYRSQSLTTLTYFIAFITIAMTIRLAGETTYSLIATGLLALSMLFILYRMQWQWLALFSIAACYGTHAIWLNPLVRHFYSPDGHDAAFWSGLIMLCIYWLTFSAAVFLTRPQNKEQDGLGLWMTAVNYALFVLVFRYHVGTAHPEWRWYFMGTLALAYLAQSWLAHTFQRRNLYSLTLVIAVLCTTMTLYFRLLGGNWVSVGWLLQAEALYAAGLLTDEKRFRWIAVVNFVLVGVWLLLKDYFMTDELSLWGLVFYKRTLIYATAAAVFYGNAAARHVMARRIKGRDAYGFIFSYAASVLWLILMARNWYPDHLLNAAVANSVLALILMEIGIRAGDAHFRGQGMFFAFLAVLSALMPLTGSAGQYYSYSMAYRIGCEAAVIVFAYTVFARFQRLVLKSGEARQVETAAAAFSAAAAVIAVLLLYREFEPRLPFWLALAWMMLGAALLETGIALKNPFFRAQGYLVSGLTLAWAVYTILARPGFGDDPLINFMALLLVVAGFFYLFARVLTGSRQGAAFSGLERTEAWAGQGPLISIIFAAAGTLVLVLLLRRELYEVNDQFIAVAWLAVAIALMEAGIAIGNGPLRVQGLSVAVIAFFYALLHNLVRGSGIGPFSGRLVTLTLCVAALYYICERVYRGEERSAKWVDLPSSGELLSWLAAALTVLLIGREVWPHWPAWVAVAWIAPLAAFYALGLKRKSAHFIGQGHALAAVIFFWTLFPTILALTPRPAHAVIEAQRVYSASLIIALFYAMFGLLLSRGGTLARPERQKIVAFSRDGFSWAASILLVALVTVEVNDVSRALTTVIWVALAIAMFEIGAALKNDALKAQGFLLAACAFGRTLIVNYEGPFGAFWFMSGRAATMLAAAAGLYYLYFRLARSGREIAVGIKESGMGAVLSALGMIVLALLIYREVHPHAWVPPAWAGLILLALALAVIFQDQRQVYQAMFLCIPVVIGCLASDFPEHGTMAGRLTVGAVVAALFAARAVMQAIMAAGAGALPEPLRASGLDRAAKNLFALAGAALLTLYIPFEFSGDMAKYLTIALAADGLVIMLLGFGWKDRFLRFGGLGILAICIVKVFYDLWILDIERIYKVIALIGLGAILILIGWIYARFSDQIKKILAE